MERIRHPEVGKSAHRFAPGFDPPLRVQREIPSKTAGFAPKSSWNDPCRAAIRRAGQARLAHGLRPANPMQSNELMLVARRMAPSLSRGQSAVYLLRLMSGVIYVGSSTDFEQRLDDHLTGQACRTTQLDPPVTVLRIETYATFSDARRRELQIKRWSRAKKEALIRGDRVRLKTLSRSRD